MDKEKMKQEAIGRINMLDLHPDVLTYFKHKDRLYYSEPTPLGGILYWLDNNPAWEEAVRKVEKEMGILVYHAIHNHFEFGECLTLLYVSDAEEEWEIDRKDLENKTEGSLFPMAYVLNLSDPIMSEFGSVGICEAGGGLIRTY